MVDARLHKRTKKRGSVCKRIVDLNGGKNLSICVAPTHHHDSSVFESCGGLTGPPAKHLRIRCPGCLSSGS